MLKVSGLKTWFYTQEGVVKAVDNVSFSLDSGTILGLVGESGCGKSVTALSILRLINHPGKIVGGKVLFEGKDILALSEHDMNRIRGRDIAMIFQEPMSSWNPVFTIGAQIDETLRTHLSFSAEEAQQRTVQLLGDVQIADPHLRYHSYPHQLSGGMLQRAMIAMAISCNPKLIIADEPTTALDVTIQAQILSLLSELRDQYGLSILLITHDLGIVAEIAHQIAVMYAGTVIEKGNAEDIFYNPCHPYSRALMLSVPRINEEQKVKQPLTTIEGTVPDLMALPKGCRFAPRCHYKMARCEQAMPDELEDARGHMVRCFLYDSIPLSSKILLPEPAENEIRK